MAQDSCPETPRARDTEGVAGTQRRVRMPNGKPASGTRSHRAPLPTTTPDDIDAGVQWARRKCLLEVQLKNEEETKKRCSPTCMCVGDDADPSAPLRFYLFVPSHRFHRGIERERRLIDGYSFRHDLPMSYNTHAERERRTGRDANSPKGRTAKRKVSRRRHGSAGYVLCGARGTCARFGHVAQRSGGVP